MMFSKSLQIRNTLTMGRGVFATQPITKGKILLKLQEDNYITYDDLECHSFFCKLISFKPQQKDRKTEFAFYMAFVNQNIQKKEDQNQKIVKYIKSLPKYFNSLICWEEDERSLINDALLREKINQKRKKIQRSYCEIKKYLTEPTKNNQNCFLDQNQISTQQIEQHNINQKASQVYEEQQNTYKRLCQKISLQEVICFYAAIQSRRIYHTTTHDLKNQIGALVPLLEMFNHSSISHVKKYDYYVRAEVNIQKQQQVFICYGQFQPEDLFETYGIVEGIQYKKQIKEDQYNKIEIKKQRKILAQAYNFLNKSESIKIS